MQLNPQERINIKRLRTDVIAKHVVTLFGLLVLAMFLLIIIHMLSNAMPLLKTPKLLFSNSVAIQNSSSILAVQQMGDEVISISQHNCKVVLNKADNASSQIVAEFHHPCSSSFVPVNNEQGYETNYAILRENGLVEIFSINHLSTSFERRLVGSFDISDFAQIKANYGVNNAQWTIDKYKNNIVVYTRIDNQRMVVIWYQLNQLEAASIQVIEQVESFKPLPRFNQAIVVYQGQSVLINQLGETLQLLSDNTSTSAKILSTPNQRTVFVPTQDGILEVWRNINVDGDFRMSLATQIQHSKVLIPEHAVFDRQTMLGILSNAENQLFIFNSATNEIVDEQTSEHPIDFLHWHNQQLFIFSGSDAHIYTLQNSAGITTWKSLFSKVQYAGYESEQYIWQTSQSAEFAETKFSLVPLIIGSLKASVLALFVAIPLALGSAIYTAYFASARLRSWVKPSIEMIEAIPSVIIGFVAAVWLAPFAERSLIALFGTLVFLPVIVILMAAVHGYLKQSELYLAWEKYYLVAASLLFLILLAGVFQLTSLLQVLMFSTHTSDAGLVLADLTISKTTVVVALALGIAVAPTIYSLVDDALFEVPDGVKHASFALGATELQTLVKVVLVVALPSIISAIMLGLGRAFGETMIVLMVTGNTPIADWDLLSGLRSLTSNLTIELQESSVDSAHYHILFLTAVILFAFTFAINTVAALLKRRLQSASKDV